MSNILSCITVAAGPFELAKLAAAHIAASLNRSMLNQEFARLALAGGVTPRACYTQLAQQPLDWGRVHLFLSDERCLPPESPARNDQMVRDTLLRGISVPAEQIHSIPVHSGVSTAAREYARVLRQHAPLDLVVLGLGNDGHCASLFPGHQADLAPELWAVAVTNSPKPPLERVSMGLAALSCARERVFLVSGSDKRQALTRLRCGELLPAALIGPCHWFVDRQAWEGCGKDVTIPE